MQVLFCFFKGEKLSGPILGVTPHTEGSVPLSSKIVEIINLFLFAYDKERMNEFFEFFSPVILRWDTYERTWGPRTSSVKIK